MKGFTQLLDFVYYVLVIGTVLLALIFFSIPGNFERFQNWLFVLTPLILIVAVFFFKIKVTSTDIRTDPEEEVNMIMTPWDKLKLEIVLTGLPIIMLVWTLIYSSVDLNSIGQAVVVFLVNTFVLRSIFKKNSLT